MRPLFAMALTKTLVHLSGVDYAIVAFYFALVLAIGWYLKGRANTGEDFFMAGREMTAWVAGLSFLSANLGALELMGWAGSAYQYGILATALVLDRRHPGHAVPRAGHDAVLLHLEDALGARLFEAAFRRTGRALSAISFAFMTVLMSGVNMFAMAKVMQSRAGLGHQFQHLGFVLTVAIYVALGGLRSAIFNEVLQFF